MSELDNCDSARRRNVWWDGWSRPTIKLLQCAGYWEFKSPISGWDVLTGHFFVWKKETFRFICMQQCVCAKSQVSIHVHILIFVCISNKYLWLHALFSQLPTTIKSSSWKIKELPWTAKFCFTPPSSSLAVAALRAAGDMPSRSLSNGSSWSMCHLQFFQASKMIYLIGCFGWSGFPWIGNRIHLTYITCWKKVLPFLRYQPLACTHTMYRPNLSPPKSVRWKKTHIPSPM